MRIKLLLAGLLTGIVFTAAGCGQAEEEKEPDLTLAVRSGTYAEVIKSCLPAFEEEHKVTVEVLEFSEEDLRRNLMADASNPDGEGKYDLCMVDGSWMADFVEGDVLTSLTELGYSLDSDIIPATTAICYRDEKVYVAPYYGNVTVLLFNRSFLAEAGYTADRLQSMEDLKVICDCAKEKGQDGFLYRGDTENNLVVDFLPFLLAYGGRVVDDYNHPTIDTPEFRDAFSFYMELIGTGEAMEKDALVQAIDGGSAAAGIGWPGWYTPKGDSNADYCAIPGKASADSPSYNTNVYGIWTIGIPQSSGKKELACKLLSHLMDPQVQKSTMALGGVPCRYSCLQDPLLLSQNPHYAAICDALENGTYRPIMTDWIAFYTILGEQLQRILDGEVTLEEGLYSAQLRLNVL